MAIDDEKRLRKITYVILGVSVAIFVAGIVMLIIGIINANKSAPDSTSDSNTPNSACSGSNLHPIAINAYTNNIQWTPEMSDTSGAAFNAAVANLTIMINNAFQNHATTDSSRFVDKASNVTDTLGKLIIGSILQPSAAGGSNSGIAFFGSLLFVGMPTPAHTDIEAALQTAGISARASANPTDQCSQFAAPPFPQTTPGVSTQPPSTTPSVATTTQPLITTSLAACSCPTPQQTTSAGPTQSSAATTTQITAGSPATTSAATTVGPSPRPPFTNCDPTMSNASVIFLVDIANPTEPGITSTIKQQLIINYLLSFAPAAVDSWQNLQMGVAVYYGNVAYMITNYLCNTSSCWNGTVNNIVVQPYSSSDPAYASHNVSAALLFALNQFSLGTNRLAILVTDGYQYGTNDSAPQLATSLKSSGVKLTAVVATPSPSVQRSITALVSVGWSDAFPLNSITQLNNPTLLTYTANWVCGVLPMTTAASAAPTTTYTLPILTTTPQTTATGPTQPPTVSDQCKYMDVLFLVDESQSIDEFKYFQNFMSNVVDAYNKLIPDARYAWIAFNSKIWVQTPFLNEADFKANMSATSYNNGNDTDFILGFTAAKDTIANYSGLTSGVQHVPLLLFLTGGYPHDHSIVRKLEQLTASIRCELKTVIMAVVMNESHEGAQHIRESIGMANQDHDFCARPHFNDIGSFGNNTAVGLLEVQKDWTCYPATSQCNLDILFMFENSALVDNQGRDLELGAVTQTLSDLDAKQKIEYFGDHVGIVYFSSKDGFNGVEYNRSGILIDSLNSNLASYTPFQAVNLLKTFDSTHQLLGGASDVLLGLNMTSTLLIQRQQFDQTNNVPVIILFGRGIFNDTANCCDSPVAFAQSLRTQYGVQMKGVVVGHSSDGNIMSNITGTPNIYVDPSVDYYHDGAAFSDGTKLSVPIGVWLDSVRQKTTCVLPPRTPYCPNYMDIVIVWKLDGPFADMQHFITKVLLAPTTGTLAGAEENTVTDRLTRIALIVYFANYDPERVFVFTSYNYLSAYIAAVDGLIWTGSENFAPDVLAKALNGAVQLISEQARPYASRSVLIIADDFSGVEFLDTVNAYKQLKQLYAGVFAVGIGLNEHSIANFQQFTDQRVNLESVEELNAPSPSSLMVANTIRDFICAQQLPPTTPPPPTTSPSGTKPTSPTVGPRKAPAESWPNI